MCKSPFKQLCLVFLCLIYIFISKISAGTSICHGTMVELSRLICVVFIFGFVLGHFCHSWYQSFRQLVSELTKALMWISAFLSQWICTVNNISRQIYLTDNPEVTHILPASHTRTMMHIKKKSTKYQWKC